MEDIFSNLKNLSNRSNQIVLYASNLRIIMKGIGRVIGKFDSELLEFLKYTNGASIFDYCFMGFKNPELGVDIDKFTMELWPSNNMLAGHFMPFMGTSTSDNFGYLMDIIDERGRHPIAYYSDLDRDRIYVIGSSFKNFFQTFLSDVEKTLESNEGKTILNIDSVDWPTNLEHWLENDKELRIIYNDGTLERFFKKNMPYAIWY